LATLEMFLLLFLLFVGLKTESEASFSSEDCEAIPFYVKGLWKISQTTRTFREKHRLHAGFKIAFKFTNDCPQNEFEKRFKTRFLQSKQQTLLSKEDQVVDLLRKKNLTRISSNGVLLLNFLEGGLYIQINQIIRLEEHICESENAFRRGACTLAQAGILMLSLSKDGILDYDTRTQRGTLTSEQNVLSLIQKVRNGTLGMDHCAIEPHSGKDVKDPWLKVFSVITAVIGGGIAFWIFWKKRRPTHGLHSENHLPLPKRLRERKKVLLEKWVDQPHTLDEYNQPPFIIVHDEKEVDTTYDAFELIGAVGILEVIHEKAVTEVLETANKSSCLPKLSKYRRILKLKNNVGTAKQLQYLYGSYHTDWYDCTSSIMQIVVRISILDDLKGVGLGMLENVSNLILDFGIVAEKTLRRCRYSVEPHLFDALYKNLTQVMLSVKSRTKVNQEEMVKLRKTLNELILVQQEFID